MHVFENCRAYVVAPSLKDEHDLVIMAQRIGFFDIASSLVDQDVMSADPGVSFFFLHHGLSDEAMLEVIEAVRGQADTRLRFAPVILMIDDCPYDIILKYVRMGFDDIISLPEKREVLASRIAAQMHTERLYFETGSYLGPDRRRMELSSYNDRRVSSAHIRLTIRRDPYLGTEILSQELRGQRFRSPPGPMTHFVAKVFDPARYAAA